MLGYRRFVNKAPGAAFWSARLHIIAASAFGAFQNWFLKVFLRKNSYRFL
jgi:hypothetical protein